MTEAVTEPLWNKMSDFEEQSVEKCLSGIHSQTALRFMREQVSSTGYRNYIEYPWEIFAQLFQIIDDEYAEMYY
jgi:hypothetical protein